MQSLNSWTRELEGLLEQVAQLLDALHTLPFHHEWPGSPPGRLYQQALEGMERALLEFWKQREAPIAELEQAVQTWFLHDQRNPDGVLRGCLQWSEALLDALMLLEPERRAAGWPGFLEAAMLQEPHLLARLKSPESGVSPEARQALALGYLEHMHPLHQAPLSRLGVRFFSLLSAFTRRSVFLPDLHLSDPDQPAFQASLASAQRWDRFQDEFLHALNLK